MTKTPKTANFNNDDFYVNYVSESNGENGEKLKELEMEADRIYEEIESFYDDQDDEHYVFNREDANRISTLNNALDKLEEEIDSLRLNKS